MPSELNGNVEAQAPPYTVFSKSQQRTIISLVSLATLASPLTAVLYLPLVPRLAAHFSTSVQAINLSITVYIIFQALAPLLLSTHSDTFGRRPIYLACFTLFAAASLGLSLNRSSYAALVALRAVQSLGASAVLSVGYGVVADLRPSNSRGKVLGTVLACSNLGTAVGPAIGGALAYTGSLWWAFWTMLVFSGSMLLALFVLLPETARDIVGDGSLQDSTWNRPISHFVMHRVFGESEQHIYPARNAKKRKLAFKSPLQALLLIRHPDVALILWIAGSHYALWYTIQASIPIIFESYSFSELQIGLCYLPGAAGVVACMYITGRVMDHNYHVIAERERIKTTRVGSSEKAVANKTGSSADATCDVALFPIERARSRFCLLLAAISVAFTVGFGWSIQAHLHPAVPLVFQFFLGFLCTWIPNMFNTLLVDIFPEMPSTAATAGNLVRCGLGAAAVAVLDPLTKATNEGLFFTIMGIFSGVCGLLAIATLKQYGMLWRRKRMTHVAAN